MYMYIDIGVGVAGAWQMTGGHMGFADRGIVPRAISQIYAEAPTLEVNSVHSCAFIGQWLCICRFTNVHVYAKLVYIYMHCNSL